MAEPLPFVLVPGLIASPRFYAAQIPALWRKGPITVADHTRDSNIPAMARRILAAAPPRFALVGHSLGGYIAFEIMRQAADRVIGLALLDTSARADTLEQSQKRQLQMDLARSGPFDAIAALQFPAFVHPSRQRDRALQHYMAAMANDNDAEIFIRQQTAIMNRPDSRPTLATIECPTVVIVGDADAATPPALAHEIVTGVRGARLVVIERCGHMSAIERPDAVTAALIGAFGG
jgi:pimeloyl-ACP methyl ester carboxylesterase